MVREDVESRKVRVFEKGRVGLGDGRVRETWGFGNQEVGGFGDGETER